MLNNGWNKISDLMNRSLFEIGTAGVTLAGLLRLLLIIIIALWISKLMRHGLNRLAARRQTMDAAALYAFGRFLHYFILFIGLLVGLSSIGLDITNFTLMAGALGVGIGFGLQSMVNNFVSGIIILFERSLKKGDFVELESGVMGQVREINFRSTRITTNDNIDILVPNSEFVNGRVTNWTLDEAHRRIHVPFGVSYGSDKDVVKKAVLEAAAATQHTLTGVPNREPQVWLVGFGDSSLNFELVVWLTPEAVKRPSLVQAAYLWEIHSALSQHGIEIPFPQRDIHLRSVLGLKEGPARQWLDGTRKDSGGGSGSSS